MSTNGTKNDSKWQKQLFVVNRQSQENKREFTEEQLAEGKSIIGLQMGTNTGASQSGMTAYGWPRQIIGNNP